MTTHLDPKTAWIPLGVAVASVLLIGGFIWKAAEWTTQTDNRLLTIEEKIDSLLEQRMAYRNGSMPEQSAD
jgi:hypothetical protein